ncbi:unnamed protein product [Mytilus coruscus]|uniref:Uncharacterized protein n=1 Tax=Mytilus coruscus TaxID=42192 RepID=A0A6J8EAB0_MYTCO|nr:unnamed protein product [Mytilus coruscus]
MALTSLLFFVAVLGTTDGLNCYGHICSGTEYCLIQIHADTGICTIPHGHGHQKEHQLCIGAHHPGDHCFCHEQACVDSMVRQQATPAPTNAPTNAPPVVTAAPTVTTAAQTVGPGQTTAKRKSCKRTEQLSNQVTPAVQIYYLIKISKNIYECVNQNMQLPETGVPNN